MSEYSSHRSSSKRDRYSSYEDRKSLERRSREDRDSGYDRGRLRSRSRSRHRSSLDRNDGSSGSYRSSRSKRKRSYERDYYESSRYSESSRHDYTDKHDRERDRDRDRDRARERDRDRDRDRDRRYASSRRPYDRERSVEKESLEPDAKQGLSSTTDNYKSRSGEPQERDSRQSSSESRSMAPVSSSAVESDALPKGPAAYFHQQSRSGWDYESTAYSQANNSTWGVSTDMYATSAEGYSRHYPNYYRNAEDYYQEGYSQQLYHSGEGVPIPPPFPQQQIDKDSASIPPPPPPPMAAWPGYTYDGLPTGPAAERASNVQVDDHAKANERSESCRTLGVDNVSQNIDLQVLQNIGYPVKATDEPTEKYEKIGQVGEGTYGKVYKAKSKVTGELVALKRIRMETEKEGFPITAMREIKLLQKLRHKRIVQLSEIMVSKGSVYMVLEYMDHDLTGVLGHPEFKFEPAQAKSLIMQMLEGVSFLHHMGVLHRDIKGSNLLLNKKGELKIADFGLARIFQKRRTHDYTNRVITLWYRPPELLLGATAYGPAVDMWSVGCIMLEFFTGKPVFNGTDEISQLEIIYKIMGTPDEKSWPTVVDLPWYELMRPKVPIEAKFRDLYASLMSEGALELLEALLALDPSKRPSASDALKFPYFTSESPDTSSPARLLDIAGDWHEYESKRKRKSGSSMMNGNGNTKFKTNASDKK